MEVRHINTNTYLHNTCGIIHTLLPIAVKAAVQALPSVLQEFFLHSQAFAFRSLVSKEVILGPNPKNIKIFLAHTS